MSPHYKHDEIYGTIIQRNEMDNLRTYYIIDCQYYRFYRWMFKYSWIELSKEKVYRKRLEGYEVTLER